MKLMIFAAGEGLRLRPYTLTRPKPCIPFLGIPMGFYCLDLFQDIINGSVIVNTFHLPNQIESTFSQHSFSKFIFSHEKEALLGSGGGLKKVEQDFIGNPNFLAANGDEIVIPKSHDLPHRFIEKHLAADSIATLLCCRCYEGGRKFGGVWVDSQPALDSLLTVKSFGKFPQDSQKLHCLHFAGVFCLSNRIFQYCDKENQPSNLIHDVIKRAMAAGEKISAFVDDFYWFETGEPNQFFQSTKAGIALIQNKNEYLVSKLNHYYPNWSLSNGNLLLDSKTLHSNIQLTKHNVLGTKISAKTPVSLYNCVVENQCEISCEMACEIKRENPENPIDSATHSIKSQILLFSG